MLALTDEIRSIFPVTIDFSKTYFSCTRVAPNLHIAALFPRFDTTGMSLVTRYGMAYPEMSLFPFGGVTFMPTSAKTMHLSCLS